MSFSDYICMTAVDQRPLAVYPRILAARLTVRMGDTRRSRCGNYGIGRRRSARSDKL